MAISDIYNSLTFGEINSLDYGVYISGPGVYDAPTRDVEFVSVPGRNGAIELDKGHWNNIEVTYKAGTFGDNQTDFAQKINAFRNAIVSQIGYQRITDTYNPEEYRLGIYASGLSVNPVNRNEAGEFDLVFNCKPQRYLLEGEDEISVSSGDTITNPTLYESGPLVKAEGYGLIKINNGNVQLTDGPLGIVVAQKEGYIVGGQNTTKNFDIIPIIANAGDAGIISTSSFTLEISTVRDFIWGGIERTEIEGYPDATATAEIFDGKNLRITVNIPEETFVVGTNFEKGGTVSAYIYGWKQGSTILTSVDFNFRLAQVASSLEWKLHNIVWDVRVFTTASIKTRVDFGTVTIDSTASILGHPTMIDLEIGDAYKVSDGQYIDLNKYIALPSDLPKLKPGENEITFDNTIIELKVTPRWWEL